MEITEYDVHTSKISKDYTFVVLSDLHDKRYEKVISYTRICRPDAIFVVGDLVDRHLKRQSRAIPFLTECVRIAPTFFSYGNHEVKYPVITDSDIINAHVELLTNSWTLFNKEILIGGQKPKADTDWLRDFEDSDEFKILLDHHPEHYHQYLKKEHPEIDLIISGHAHGGQIRIKDQGFLAPGQGILPKYTKGFYDNRLIVGAGLANTGYIIPRLGNPTEVLKINLIKD